MRPEKEFDKLIDARFDKVDVCGLLASASKLFKVLNYNKYDELFNRWYVDGELMDGDYEVILAILTHYKENTR